MFVIIGNSLFLRVDGVQVNQYNRSPSTLMSAYKNIKDNQFIHYILKQKADIVPALKHFFPKEDLVKTN